MPSKTGDPGRCGQRMFQKRLKEYFETFRDLWDFKPMSMPAIHHWCHSDQTRVWYVEKHEYKIVQVDCSQMDSWHNLPKGFCNWVPGCGSLMRSLACEDMIHRFAEQNSWRMIQVVTENASWTTASKTWCLGDSDSAWLCKASLKMRQGSISQWRKKQSFRCRTL